jgi:hypothetical protein
VDSNNAIEKPTAMKTAARDRMDKTPRDFLRCPVLAVARAMDEAAHFLVGIARDTE